MVDLKPLSKYVFPVYILNWIFGVGVIHYPLGHPHPVISFFYSSTCTIVYCILAGITYPDIIEKYNVTNSQIPIKIIFYSNIILTIATITLGWFRSEGMHKCLTLAAMSDVVMEKIGMPINYMKMLRAQIPRITAALVFLCLILMTILLSQTAPLAMRILPTIVLGFPVIITLISDATHIGLLSTATYRFQRLNQLLKSMLTTAVDYPQHKRIADRITEQRIPHINDKAITDRSVLKNQANFIKSAKEIHILLVRLCHEGNDAYAIQLLLTIVVAFGVITGHLYNIYTVLQNSYVSKETINNIIFSSGVWIIFYTTKICMISSASNRCADNAIKTGDLINEYYDEPWISTDTKSEIRDFNIQLIQRPLKFSAAGFVNVDLSLIQVMIATITTYLVILIQLGNFPKVATTL